MSTQWTSAATRAQGVKPGLVIRMGMVIGMLVVGLFGALPSLEAQSPLTIQPSTGNVGIGTTNPSQQLHITGNFLAGGALIMFPGTGNYPRIGKAGDDLTFSTNASLEMVRFTNSGNVGIGTTTPAGRLHVISSSNYALIVTGAANTAALSRLAEFSVSSAPNYAMGFGFEPSSGTVTYGGTNNDFFLASNVPSTSFINLASEGGIRFTTYRNAAFSTKMILTNAGDVGIGTTTPTSRLHVIGDITATGAKNFQIDHPLEPDKKLLVHSALEGPEVAVYYRGEAQLVNGEVVITLPSYFESLTRKEQRTAQLTPIKGWSPLYVSDEIEDGKFTVRSAAEGNLTQRFYWEVKAVRADVPSLVVEKTKEAENMKLAENQK